MKERSYCSLVLAVGLTLFAVPLVAVGQVATTGLPPFGSFDSDSISSISLANLNVHFEISLRSLPGRGIPLNARLVTDSDTLGLPGYLYGAGSPIGWPGTGLAYVGAPAAANFVAAGFASGYVGFQSATTSCSMTGETNYGDYTIYSNFYYLDTHGTPHFFPSGPAGLQVAGVVSSTQQPCPYYNSANPPGQNVAAAYAMDGSPYVLYLSNGTSNAPAAYVIDESNGVKNDSVDPNGNQNTYSANTLTDSSGNVAMTTSFTADSTTFSWVGPDGDTKNIVVTFAPFNITGTIGCTGIKDPGAATVSRASMIKLPDGTSYSFTYDPVLGRPAVITLPTGGQITYTYTGANNGVSCVDGGTSGFTKQTPAGTWQYSRAYSSSTGLWMTTVTDPQNNQTVITFGNGSGYLILGGHAAQYEVQRVQNQFNATTGQQVPLKTTVTCYNGNFTNCATAVFPTAAANGAVQTVSQKDVYTYLVGVSAPSLSEIHYQFANLVTEDKEYDFGATLPPGTNFIRDRKITYQAYSCPLSDTTTNSSGSIVAETTYTCDIYGHATGVSQLVSGSTFITTKHTYYNTGLLATTTDPRANVTSYSYADCNNSFPTSVKNAADFTTSMTWYCDGEVLNSVTDPNGITTSYSYDDFLDRLTLVDSAPGTLNWATNLSAESQTAYHSTVTETTVAQDQTAPADGVLKSSTSYDALNRAIKTVARDGSVIETAYDPLSRVCAVSNPTFTDPGALSCTVGQNKTTATTDGYTYFSYDALGRKTWQTQPDLSKREWVYTGNLVDFYDETNGHWQWTYDALGRLTKTLENGPVTKTLTLETDYTYDPLDNLLSVNQKGASGDTPRYRTFTYDSLSRLTNACNPETIAKGGVCTPTAGPWSAAYTYDANGNVIKRTDARGIATNYTYDALNRVTAKSYTNDPANTPALSYGYDTEYSWQIPQNEDHPVGHLNSILATLGTTNLTTWTSGDYDQRGSLLGYVNCLGANAQGCPGAGVGANYAYNLNEDLTGISATAYNINYNGELDLSYGFDPSGRLSSIATGVRLGPPITTLTSTAFSGLMYYPGGAMDTANLAIDPTTNVAGIALVRTYDNRGRITSETDTSSLGQSAYNYTVSYDGSGSVKSFNDSVAGAWTVSMDVLHRLSGLSGNLKGVPVSMQETYDSFGDRNVEYYTYNGTQTQPSPYLNFYKQSGLRL